MPFLDDIGRKAELAKNIKSAMEGIGAAKRRWLKEFGADSEPQVDLIIKEASDRANEIVAMNDDEYLDFMKEKSLEMLKEIITHADDIEAIDDDEEEEFKNERRENGNLKERIS